ncbi:MAG: chitobiase/beta-hexosaminidase C-terminal domain-containing protein [Patescibacteria group bacterium]|nr:chitobiase/beta-hexosaminidase C-terminal domain-containing protein [Patescibacteria group bacterium]
MRYARILLALLLTPLAHATVAITANVPQYGIQVLPGSTRTINVAITGGTANTVNWSVSATTGGATASFVQFGSGSLVSSVSGGLPVQAFTVGSTAGTCTISPGAGSGPWTLTSTATVTIQAQSVDDGTKIANFVINVCANTTTVLVAPAYQQAYQGQQMTVQSWVTGNVNESGTWSITSQPVGGNGTLTDTTNRDAQFSATVTGRYTLKYTSAADNTKSSTAIVYVSPNPMPAYSVTPNGTVPHECYVDPALTGADYEVGPGKTYTTIQGTPAMNTWAAGSIMRIWNTDTTGTSPTTYHEYFQVATSGTATQPIIVCGVPDATGNLPIVSGQNATTQSGTSTAAAQTLGIITTWGGGYGRGTPYGYWQSGSAGPSYISITGLHIMDATPNFTATPPGGGTAVAWGIGASCVNLRGGSYIDVAGDDMDTCTNGIFTAENANSMWANITQEITVMGNHIHGSGWSTDSTEHQVYFQSFFGLFERNRVDNYLSTAQGSNVKWRGVEGIFRYNFIGTGPSRDFDLVENQDAGNYVSFDGSYGYIADGWNYGDTAGANVITGYQESMKKDFVYGNIIQGASAQYQNHYAEDHDGGMADRNGTLQFFSNTLDHAQVLFDTGSALGYNPYFTQQINAQNNIFWTYGTQTEFGKWAYIIFNPTTNLMKSGTFSIATPINGGNYNAGTSNGWENSCDYTCPWLLTVPLNPHLYNLTNANYLTTSTIPYSTTTYAPPTGSAAISAGTAQTGILATMPVRYQYVASTGGFAARTQPLTLGAVDAAGGTPTVATPSISPAAGTYSSPQTVSITDATSGAVICYTTDGTTPTASAGSCTHGTTYSGAFVVSVTSTVQAIGTLSGYTNSGLASSAYTITLPTAATPTFTPAAGTYVGTQTVTINDATAGFVACYTTDGSTPTGTYPSCTHGTQGTTLTVASSQTVKAIAMASGYNNSSVGSAAYIINAATPSVQTIIITCTPTCTVVTH